MTIILTEAGESSSDPRAIISPKCDELQPILGKPFTVDALQSYDRPAGSQIVSYTWDWGDDSPVGSGVVATHTYTRPGSYKITLVVADGETPPNTSSAWCTVIITGEGPVEPTPSDNQPPFASFTVDPTRGYADATVFTFDAGGSMDPDGNDSALSYFWSFGDGDTATGEVVTHRYEQPNPDGYVVRLTVRDEGNASTDTTQEVVVEDNAGNLPPHAYIATGPRSGTAPLTLSFDGRNSFDLNGDTLEFTWQFKSDDVVVDVLIGPVVTRLFDEPGTYTVELEVSDKRGGFDTAGPEEIRVMARGEQPGDEEPGQEVPDGEQPSRPRLCGFGMLMSLFGSLLGLVATMAVRRRFSL